MNVDEARRLATEAHRSQLDKSGAPYIGHPLRVAKRLDSVDEQVVALLHDVLEDTPVTVDDLAAAGATEAQLRALELLCHAPGVDDLTYWRSVRSDPLALIVKIADIADNTDPARVARLDARTAERLAAKYRNALAVLAWGDQVDGVQRRPAEWPRMRAILEPSAGTLGEGVLAGTARVDPGSLPAIPDRSRPDPVDLDQPGVQVDDTHTYRLLVSERRADPGLFLGRVRRCADCGLGFRTQDADLRELYEASWIAELACPFCGRHAFNVEALYSDEFYVRGRNGTIRRRSGNNAI